MRKTGRYLVLAAFVLVCILLNVILFLTVDDQRLTYGSFWMAWAFTFPWNLLVAVLIHFWIGKGDADLVKMPVALTVSYTAFAVNLIVGAILMYAPIEKIVGPLIIELIINVTYVLVCMYTVYATEYVVRNQKQTKQKVLYIRMLKADVDDILAVAEDAAVRMALTELSERVRFSDPMSHPSLAGIEGELSMSVSAISSALAAGETEGAMVQIKKTADLLERRNSRCLMLK